MRVRGLPTQRDWQALFRAAAHEGLEVYEVAAGDVRVSLRLKGLAREAESYVEDFKRKQDRQSAGRKASSTATA